MVVWCKASTNLNAMLSSTAARPTKGFTTEMGGAPRLLTAVYGDMLLPCAQTNVRIVCGSVRIGADQYGLCADRRCCADRVRIDVRIKAPLDPKVLALNSKPAPLGGGLRPK